MFEYNLYRAMTPEAGIAMLTMLLTLGYRIAIPFTAPYQPKDAPLHCKKATMIESVHEASNFTQMLKDDAWPCGKWAVEMAAFKGGSPGMVPPWLRHKMLHASARGKFSTRR